MIKKITVTNVSTNLASSIEMGFPEKSGFLIKYVNGLGPSKASVNLTSLYGRDGAIWNSSRVEPRNIVFSMNYFNNDAEIMRHKSYRLFPIGKEIKIVIETDTRTVETHGFVESNESDIFSSNSGFVASVLCPDPYLYDVDYFYFLYNDSIPLFQFPFSNNSLVTKLLVISGHNVWRQLNIINSGDVAVGVKIRLEALDFVVDPAFYDVGPGGSGFTINSIRLENIVGTGIVAGDIIEVSSEYGDKYASLIRGSTTYNILNALYPADKKWIYLIPGDNIISFTAASGQGNAIVSAHGQFAYQGV